MGIRRRPFTPTRLQEERDQDKGRKISVWLNEEEDAQLIADMQLLDIGVDAAALKKLARIGSNTLHSQLGDDVIKYLVSQKRTRFDGRKK